MADDPIAEEEVGASEAALTNANGLMPNGWDLNGLNWNGGSENGLNWNALHLQGLNWNGSGNVTTNIDRWLRGKPGALEVMPYLVACAAPSGRIVTATIRGTSYAWPGVFGLASTWLDNNRLDTAGQEWVSACLLAHVNLLGNHVLVSFRGSHPGLSTTSSERSSHNCREAAFMGNLFAGWETDPLPVLQCHEEGAQTGTGRACDPSQGYIYCKLNCSSACVQTSDYYTSCDVEVDGQPRAYSRIITTYLPTDSTQGCLGWGYAVDSSWARFQSSASGGGTWQWDWNFAAWGASCSQSCGGYAWGGCSCTPDCQSKGTCCSDYASVCGTSPAWSGPTDGVSSCPAGYTMYTGSLSDSTTYQYHPSSSGYVASTGSVHHGTLLNPTGADFDLYVEIWTGSEWRATGQSHWWGNESLHYFYGKAGSTYRWKVQRYSGSGTYTFCLKRP